MTAVADVQTMSLHNLSSISNFTQLINFAEDNVGIPSAIDSWCVCVCVVSCLFLSSC